MEDQPPSANNTRDIECGNPITEVEVHEENLQYFDGRQIQKLVQIEQLKKRNEDDNFTPKIVSFGPHYHGLPQLGKAEEFKHEVLAMSVSSSGKDEQFLYCQIFKLMDQIRNCYVGVSRAEYDDGALAEMMLLDASFAVYIMRTAVTNDAKELFYLQKKLGLGAVPIVLQDMYLLENQIPLWVIMHLSKLTSGNKKEGPDLLHKFLRETGLQVDWNRITRILGEDKRLPLHILDAIYQVLVQELDNPEPAQPVNKCQWKKASSFSRWMNTEEYQNQNQDLYSMCSRQFRSVTELKAKGIHFKPSSHCLYDIDFKSYTFYGLIQLPVWFFSDESKLLFTHLIAYELQPESLENPEMKFTVTFYISFLKSILLKSEDVRELREKKILFSDYDSDEQVLREIKEIDTFRYKLELEDVKMRIEDHCSSKAKTWMAELIHTYFHDPWTSIALLAATALLILTFLQTYYTMNP